MTPANRHQPKVVPLISHHVIASSLPLLLIYASRLRYRSFEELWAILSGSATATFSVRSATAGIVPVKPPWNEVCFARCPTLARLVIYISPVSPDANTPGIALLAFEPTSSSLLLRPCGLTFTLWECCFLCLVCR